jgi:arylsulfatase A-like enzyme
MKILKIALALLSVVCLLAIYSCREINTSDTKNQYKKSIVRPNILILMSDNQSAEHLGCYGDKSVKTPNIDNIAKDGILFKNAFCSAPSCSPARAAMLSGQDIWRLKEAANLWGSFPKVKVFTDILEKDGYSVGIEGKGWAPGNEQVSGWDRNPGGEKYNSIESFINQSKKTQPWVYWYSSTDPHRPFRKNGWESSGINLDSIFVPPYLPDNIEVRKDIADYYDEIQIFDNQVGSYISFLKEIGQLENTVVVVCSDNGWQMPRGLANLYDFGTKIPLIISWPKNFVGGRVIDDFINLKDFAPTFLELAKINIPEEMNANSFYDLLISKDQGKVNEDRNSVIMARERHAFVRQGGKGYPGRAIRTEKFLYIRNYTPERWPAGDPPLYGDVDAHMLHYDAPTKIYILKNKLEKEIKPLFDLAFNKRPNEELYDLNNDPYQLVNLSDDHQYKSIKKSLSETLTLYLIKSGDPRETEVDFDWDNAYYYEENDKTPKPSKKAINELGLKTEYNYLD